MPVFVAAAALIALAACEPMNERQANANCIVGTAGGAVVGGLAGNQVGGGTGHTITLQVDNANQPVSWSLVSGTLPEGMTLLQAGTIVGSPVRRGSHPLTVRVRDAIGLQADLSLTLEVTDPEVPVETLVNPFLLQGGVLPLDLRTFLDNEGNRNGLYDLGDFRAFVLRNPDLQVSGEAPAAMEILVPLGDLRVLGSGGGAPSGEPRKEDVP
jgi:hypothetical protein